MHQHLHDILVAYGCAVQTEDANVLNRLALATHVDPCPCPQKVTTVIVNASRVQRLSFIALILGRAL